MAWFRADVPQSGGTQFGDLMALAGSTTDFDLTDTALHTEATNVPQYMFYDNQHVRDIDLSPILEVKNSAFYNCSRIRDINLPNCTRVKSNAFYRMGGTYKTALINLPKVTVIEDYAFREMKPLSTAQDPLVINLPLCQELWNMAFSSYNTTNLSVYIDELDLPAIVSLGPSCFYNVHINTLKIGSNCTSFGYQIFSTQGSLDTLIVNRNSPPSMAATGLGITPTHIYVPDDADVISAYKSATGWSNYASIIEGIPTT